jgi:hypothetical protein
MSVASQRRLWPVGWLVERLALGPYLRRLLVERAAVIRRVAESDEWRRYLPAALS